SCLTICSARAGLQCATIVMRERPGSESGTTIKRSILYPRELNRPVMLNKTPNRFSTRIEKVNIGSCSIKIVPTDRSVGDSSMDAFGIAMVMWPHNYDTTTRRQDRTDHGCRQQAKHRVGHC